MSFLETLDALRPFIEDMLDSRYTSKELCVLLQLDFEWTGSVSTFLAWKQSRIVHSSDSVSAAEVLGIVQQAVARLLAQELGAADFISMFSFHSQVFLCNFFPVGLS